MKLRFQQWRLSKGKRNGWDHRGFMFVLLALLLFALGFPLFTTAKADFLHASEGTTALPPPTSVLHPITPTQAPLNPDVAFTIQTTNAPFSEYTESFPQHGKAEPGQHYRIENTRLLAQAGNRENDSVLIVTVFNNAESWGVNRNSTDFFQLVNSFDYPKSKISIAMLTSSIDEFTKVKELFNRYVDNYAQLSVIFRNDFELDGLTRDNRHASSFQADRRRMLARYRNYALLSTLETWHQHVLWLDADIDVISADLLPKMTQCNAVTNCSVPLRGYYVLVAGLDIVEPMCARKYSHDNDDWYDYDLNAWVGQRKVRPALRDGDFIPGPLSAKSMHDLRGDDFVVPLDSVGGTMLYVRADVHRQGVLFPPHYVIGSEWAAEGYDGIETEGLCYIAHFLGFKCWGMPNDLIFHAT
ncbi:hypothetical protein BBJ28_00014829 [Nothophytophthora sp. Chile5]|nr:hypothetical protein BBJ28_00014829 [Nothophytophthora sp. Chile5]